MGISDELRDLAATPPEATALSASLADQAIGFAVRARRVAHMKVAAAVSAVTIAAAGVGIGIVTSNNDSELPTTTPVVTITSTPSGSPSSPQSLSSQSPSQEPSSAPVLEQSPAPQQPVEVQSAPEQTTGPEPEKNIVERIIDTLASIPQWVIDQFTHQDQPADPGQTTTTTQTSSAESPTPSEQSSSTSPTSSQQQSRSSSSSATPFPAEKPSSSDGTTPKCQIVMEWKNNKGETHQRSIEVDCASKTPMPRGSTSGSPSNTVPKDINPADLKCTLIITQEGQESTATPSSSPVSSSSPVKCPPVPW